MKAIETRYKGYRFRSRLEARWAVYFDSLGITWEYEKEGFDLGEHGWYLPDFWLPQFSAWAEVKAAEFTDTEREKCRSLSEESDCLVLMLDGQPEATPYFGFHFISGEADGHELCDYVIDASYIDENRFFASTGMDDKEALDPDYYKLIYKAVNAARSARFEHGECGATV